MEPSRSEDVPESPERHYSARPKPLKRKCQACRTSKRKCEPSHRDWSKGEKCLRCLDRGELCSEPTVALRKRRTKSKTTHPTSAKPLSRRASCAVVEDEVSLSNTPTLGNQLPSPRTRSRTSMARKSFSEGFELRRHGSERIAPIPGGMVNTPAFSELEYLDGSAQTTNHSAEIYLILEYSRKTCDAIGRKDQLECDVESTRDEIEHLSYGLEKHLFAIPRNISRRYSTSEAHEHSRTSQIKRMDSICRNSHLFGLFDSSLFRSHSLEEQWATFLRQKIDECCRHKFYGWLCILLRKLCSLPHGKMTEHDDNLLAESYLQTSTAMKPFLHGYNIYPDEERIFPSDVPFPALHRAILDEQIGAVKALINNPNLAGSQPDILKRQPIHIAAVCSSPEILQCVVDQCRRDDLDCRDMFLRTPLAYAAQSGNLENFKMLHKAGARLDNRDAFGHSILTNAASSGQIEIVRYMLDEKIQPNDNRISMGPLHKAVENGHQHVVELLLERGAQDRKLKTGKTACDIGLERNLLDIVKAIKDHAIAQPSSDMGPTRTADSYDLPNWLPNMSGPFIPSDLGNISETANTHQNLDQPATSPSNPASVWPGSHSTRNPQSVYPSWTNSHSEYQQLPFTDANPTNASNLNQTQMLIGNSMSYQAPLPNQYPPPITPSTLGSTFSGYSHTAPMHYHHSSGMDPFNFHRSRLFPPSFERYPP